ncbi:MAG: mucoidy inhibitor MuiA family protein [Tepidisphaeraceae bacterium]
MKLALWLAVGSVLASTYALHAQPATAPGTAAVAARQPVATAGKIDAVTVYRGQAMVTRVIDVPGQHGLTELVVGDLPGHVLPTSLFAEADAGVQVRSVLYRERTVEDDVRAGVREIDDAIAELNLKLAEVERAKAVLQQNADYLNKLEAFTATTANVELSKGVLNADTLQKLSEFVFSKREALAKQSLAAEQQGNDLRKQIELQQRKRAEITQGASRVAREAVLVVDVQNNAAGEVRMNYLVDQAGWEPSYTINATAGKEDVSLLYQAAITQMSGEDWTDVKMTLSTATPSVVARAPKLEPLALALTRAQPEAAAAVDELRAIQDRRRDVAKNYASNNSLNLAGSAITGGLANQPGQQQQAQGGGSFNSFNNGDVSQYLRTAQRENEKGANKVAGEAQVFELKTKDADAARAVSRVDAETVTVSYSLPNRTSLPSRSDQQLVGIATMPVKAQFYKVAAPVLTPYVYNEASIRNTSPQVLLAGPAVSYLNGEFVGHGELPTVAIGETFTAGFGIDHSLRASRELLSKTESQQGGNTIAKFEYTLRVENFSDAPAKVRLTDRIPMADGAALKPTMADSSVPVSTDPDYQAGPAKKGILRFDIDAAPQTSGTKATTVKYSLTLEYERQMQIIAR